MKNQKRNFLKKFGIGFLALFTTSVVGMAGIFLLILVAYLIVGNGWNETVSDIQNIQIGFWFTILGLISTCLVWNYLKRRKSLFLVCSRRFFLVFASITLIGSSIGTSIGYVIYSSNSSNGTCNIQDQLIKARSSVYAIQGDKGSGSAIAISSDGKLLTAYHVIEDNPNLKTYITDNQNNLTAIPVRILSISPETDLALLSIDRQIGYMDLVEVEDRDVGSDVYAVGFPVNAFEAGSATVTKGITSRLINTSDIPGASANFKLIQTDAALNPGNSGGALVGKCGVIGVNDAISEASRYAGLPREEGISYAIDTFTIKKVFGL